MKKTKRIIALFLIISSSFFISCSSDDNNNKSFGTTTGDFLPLAINNRWNYFDAEQSLLNEVKIISTTSFSGNTYYEYTDDSDPVEMQHWFGKKGATYFLRTGDTSFVVEGTMATLKSYEVPILKDDFAVNETWSGSVSPKLSFSFGGATQSIPFKVNYTGTNYFKGQLTLNGINYPNVIKTKMEISINANGQTTNSTEEYWFAEDIGIIKSITVNIDNSISERDIETYSLN